VQAPHNPAPQPNFVPVNFKCSRIAQSSGISGEDFTLACFPLIVNATIVGSPLSLQRLINDRTATSSAFFNPGRAGNPLFFVQLAAVDLHHGPHHADVMNCNGTSSNSARKVQSF
jgi:hypothetical protein